VPLPSDKIGKRYPGSLYAVGREKIREYALAVGETEPLYLDLDAARAAGHADLVAPPMFAVVYSNAPVVTALFDPELEIDFAMLVHAAQEFRWEQLVIAGDEITTTGSVKDISEKAGMRFYVFETVSVNQRGETVAVGTWSNLIRPSEAQS
jgi:acyl dehydratase